MTDGPQPCTKGMTDHLSVSPLFLKAVSTCDLAFDIILGSMFGMGDTSHAFSESTCITIETNEQAVSITSHRTEGQSDFLGAHWRVVSELGSPLQNTDKDHEDVLEHRGTHPSIVW